MSGLPLRGMTLSIVWCLAAAACGGGSGSMLAPSAQPSSSVHMSSPPALTLPGDVFRLFLTTDGTASDVSANATWSSSAPEIVEVTGGSVHALAAGEAEIRASYADVVLKTTVVVTPLTSLDGLVHETSPTSGSRIADALVSIVGGRFDGSQTRTDSRGGFHLANVAGSLRIRVTHAGFDTYESDVSLDAVHSLDVSMNPTAIAVTDVYSFSTAYQPGDPPLRVQDEFSFPTHSAGNIQVTVDGWRTPYDGDYLTVEVLSGQAVIGHLQNCDALGALVIETCTGSHLPDGFTVPGANPGVFLLRIASERRLILGYQVRVTHIR